MENNNNNFFAGSGMDLKNLKRAQAAQPDPQPAQPAPVQNKPAPKQPMAAPTAPGGVSWFKRPQEYRDEAHQKMFNIWNGTSDEDMLDVLNKYGYKHELIKHLSDWADLPLAKKYAKNYDNIKSLDFHTNNSETWDVSDDDLFDLYVDYVGEPPLVEDPVHPGQMKRMNPMEWHGLKFKELYDPDFAKEDEAKDDAKRKEAAKYNKQAAENYAKREKEWNDLWEKKDSNDEELETAQNLFGVNLNKK